MIRTVFVYINFLIFVVALGFIIKNRIHLFAEYPLINVLSPLIILFMFLFLVGIVSYKAAERYMGSYKIWTPLIESSLIFNAILVGFLMLQDGETLQKNVEKDQEYNAICHQKMSLPDFLIKKKPEVKVSSFSWGIKRVAIRSSPK